MHYYYFWPFIIVLSLPMNVKNADELKTKEYVDNNVCIDLIII